MKAVILLFGGIGGQEILVIILIILLFFGGKKIPELMKGVGKGIRSFKEGINEAEESVRSELPLIEKEKKEE